MFTGSRSLYAWSCSQSIYLDICTQGVHFKGIYIYLMLRMYLQSVAFMYTVVNFEI